MESAESDREGESREKPHPVPPSVQEGSSNLLCEKEGMKPAAPKSNKQQPFCTDHPTDTVLASQGGCDTSSSLGWVRSNPSAAYDSNTWENLSTNTAPNAVEEEKLQAYTTSAELLGDHHAGQKSSPKSRDDTSARANEEKILGHQRREEQVEQRNYNRRDDRESKENLRHNNRTGRNYAEDNPLPGAAARGWEKCTCLENPYLFNERLRTEETMTLEFVAVMSKKSRFSEETSKICVAFYKQPGQYQEFAVLKKRKKVIVGHALIPISDLQTGPIFYKYAIFNNVLSTDSETRLCDLEHIYGMDSKNTESQLHRVINIPKEEIKANGTWTIFEHMKCYFHEKKKNYFKFWSSTTMPQKSVNCGVIEYLADEFLQPIKLQHGFKNIERKLEIYTESFKIYLGDAAKGKPYSPTELTKQVLNDNMIKFMDKIIGYLETEEHKDDGLLFALHTSFCYKIPLSKQVIVKAEKLFQDIGPFQGKFKHLRGKSNYISAVKEICLSNKDNTLWIWLIPLLYAITEKTEDPFFSQNIPLQHLSQLRNDEEQQRKVLVMVEIHKSFIESCSPLAKAVLEMLALKNLTKDSLLQIKFPSKLLLDTVYQRIVEVVSKPSQVHEKDLNGVLTNIAERMAFWFKDLCLPGDSEQLTKPMNKEDALPCLNSTYALLLFSLKHWHAVPFSLIMSLLQILEMFAAKSNVLQANQEFQEFISKRFDEFADCIKEWLEKYLPRPPMENTLFLEDINVWHELFLFEILCVEWTEKWQRLIYSMVERWLEKVDGRKLLDFYLEFIKKDEHRNAALEMCFTDCVIQRIKCFETNEEPMLGNMVSNVLQTDRSTAGKLLSAVVEKIFSDKMSTLEKVDRFVDSTGPVLVEVLSSSVVYDLLSAVKKSEHKLQNQINEKAKFLLFQFSNFFCFLRHQVFSGDIPCNILSTILQHQEPFQNILRICDSSVSSCVATVLKVRREEYEQLEEQKKQRCSFLRLCNSIEDVIRVDRSAVKKSIGERASFKDQTSVSKFSVNGEKEIPKSYLLTKYSDMMKKIHILEESNYFFTLCKQKAKQIKAANPEEKILLIEDVQENIYKPAIADFQSTYLALKDFSITFGTVQSHFEKQLANESQLRKEFEIMEMSEGQGNGKAAWVDAAVEKIKNYLTLSTVVNTAKMIDELRKMLELNGNFQILSDLTKYEEMEFRNKRLDYMTQDLMKVKNSLSNLPEETLDFLRELLECTRKGFVSWIKTIIKDKTEIPVFVELATIYAGENDIRKVRFFRDAMAASAPIIFDLTPTSGFKQFSATLSFISEATAKDNDLPKKLKDSCDNKEWIQMVHDFHGSIEHSSISQARDINSRGIFVISAPQKFRATLEDCVSVLLLKDTTEEASQTDQKAKEYSLAQLTELQNKLMLITTKAEQSREETNRFLEILEKVQMVGKLYLQLLSAGNILFIDWKADIYCNPQHRVKVYTEFGIAGILVQSTRPILEELDGLCKAMDHCLVEWKKYLETQRDTYYHLNLFTAHQLFYLCSQLAKAHSSVIEPQILNMLSVIKHDIKEEDIRKALEQALMTPLDSVNTSAGDKESVTWHDYVIRFPQLIRNLAESGYDTSVAKAALQSCLPNSDITEQKLMNFAFERGDDKDEVENLSKLYDEQREAFLQKSKKFKNKNRDVDQATFSILAEDELATSFESLPSICDKVNLLWDAYCKKFTGLVSDKYISLDVFGETLKQLAALETTYIKRSLPVGLEDRKPSLIMCKEEEMLLYMLSIYTHTKTAPLPTYDEVLVCTPNTEEEEVELIVRRALSSDSQNQKIYCLLGAEKLVYKVSKQLESHFFRLLQSSTVPDYRFIIFCNAKAHNSYVTTAFDTYKVTIPCYSKTEIQAYLSTHLKVPCGTAPIAQAFEEPYQQNVKFVFSDQAGMGKSLFVENTLRKIRAQMGGLPVVHKTIRLMESEIDFQFLLEELLSVEDFPTETQPTVFHIDVSPAVSTGLYRLLIDLCILRHIQSPNGLVWKCKSSHLYLIEYLAKGKGVSRTRKQEVSSETEEKFLDLFPTVKCVSPMRVLDLLERPGSGRLSEMKEEQFDQDKLNSEAFQRSYQYLIRYKRGEDLDHFFFIPQRTEGTKKECLKLLLEFCGRHNPSWTELSNFTHFLNFQLSKCEKSVFCGPAVGEDFQGFKTFVIKFMITMSKDFAVPSLDISDESVPSAENYEEENSIMRQYQLRRKWEHESHPYIVFHADNNSMEFLGFHISNNLDAIDAHSQAVLERNVIKYKLYRTLEAQHVPFNKKFEYLPRTMQLEALCRVFGVSYTQDPDESYRLTLDNTMKMLAIHLRFQCGIPVIIMGETGCGKTKLVQFMCSLQRAGRNIQNMVVVRVHGGTTSKTIHKKVRQAIELAIKNEEEHKVDTVLFFDEANTSEAIFAIKEVLCDRSVNGEKIPTDCLKVVTACNPYKRHTKKTIEKLEKAGLGYRVRSEDTLEKLGYIPLRQLVYRVKPLPPSLLPLVWDFGELNEMTQSLYIREIVKSTMKNKITIENLDIFTSVISASQKFLSKKKDECRVASLRDIERCMNIALWFYKLRDLLFPQIDKKKDKKEQQPILNDAQRALVLSVGACYYVSLESRKDYLEEVAKCFSVPASLLQQEIELCQEVFLDNLPKVPEATARNDALRENIFMIVVCMDLRVPLFLVGKPGSSKSLSKTIVVDAMEGSRSNSQLFKRCKEIQLMSFQCSPHSKPEGIISTFRKCAQFQKEKNLDEFASVVLLDEIGLAEDSPEMPLKVLHPILEDGCVDDENPEPYQKVGFVGISNWALDPAKMNRGLLVFRTDPSKEELIKTAEGICAAQPYLKSIEYLFPSLAEFYCKVLETQKNEYFGLRDFYSLIKTILSYTQGEKCISQEEIIIKAIQRNFGGSSDINPVELFRNCISEVNLPHDLETCHTLRLLKENMGKQQAGLLSRYLLLLTTNHAAFHIIQMTQLIDIENCEIIFGSGFPQDQDYSQVCRSVSRVKICMETGRPVVLLNIHNLYESLYDALNQCFLKLGENYYVDLGLGTHKVRSCVKAEFRLIVIEEKNTVYTQFPTPLLNRLEKHCLDMNTVLNWQQQQLKQDLQAWARLFVSIDSRKFSNVWSTKLSPKEQDVFIGFSNDTCAAVALESTQSRSWGDLEPYEESVLSVAKRKLVQCATPDSILRLKYSFLDDAEQIQDLYFHKQKHNSLVSVLRETVNWQPRKEKTAGLCLQVSTHARLLNERDLEEIRKTLNLQNKIHCLFLSQFDTEYTFRQELRNFFAQSSEEKLLLIQFHFDEPQSSRRLLACAKYCVIDERRKSTGTSPSHVVLATQVPRVLGGCSYLAFDSGEWTSIHLDDLMPPDNFTANLGQLAKMTIAEIFMTTFQGHLPTGSPEESAALEDPAKSSLFPEENLLSMESMIKQSIQKAVIQLEDKTDNSRRATERIMIIHNLLFQDHSRTTFSSHFMCVLKRRICRLLQEREETTLKPREWVFRRAVSSEFILEDTSFRHALWMHLEDIVANLFAQILAVVDANNNLDHLFPLSPLSELWLQMFKEESFLRIKYTNKKQDAKISVLSMTEDPNTSVFCQFPFSWVLKAYLEELWERVYNMKGHPKVPMKEPAKLFQVLTKNVLIPDGSNPEMMQCYTNDFLRMTFPGQDISVYEILSKALLVNAKQLCSSVGQEEISFSPIWLHMEYFYLREEYQLFVDLVKSDKTVTSELQKMYEKDPPEMFVTLDTLNILLKKVQPTDNLLSFEACTEWLRRVKSIKPWMEWISTDNYQIHLYQKKRELLRSVLHQWTCTNIVYMFFDHLLHNETQIDNKFLRLLVKQFIFIWNRLNETQNFEPAETFELVTKVLKKCNQNADTVYLVKGVKDCKSCLLEITDPAELPCGHIFCSQCIREWRSKQCKICKNDFPEDYTPTATAATREAVACHNKFRRKCNSFFVEFVTTSVLGDRGTPSPEVITQLIQFVVCKPPSPEHQAVKRVCKSKIELSPFEECMDTSPTIKSSLLKLLLRYGFNNIKVHLEKYLSEMEERITFNKRNWDHFYFMVVRCLEDFMYPSSQDDVNQLAESCLSTADLSAFVSCKASKLDTLQFIARLRFSISHVATVLGRQVLCVADPNIPSPGGNKQEEQDLVNAMKKLVANAQTPWPQIFLIRNLCNNYGFIPMQKILQAETWVLPREVEISQHMVAWSNITLMFSVLNRAKNHIKNKDPQEVQRLMSVIKQMENILQTPLLLEESLENKMEKIIDALCRHENKVLMEVVFHTAFTLALSQSPITQLFRNICFKPCLVKGSYLPTMPEDLLFDQKNWKIGKNDTPWACQCGLYWIVTDCGRPSEVKKCLCGAKIGGIHHIPERGFIRKEITEDKTGKGYILGSPSIRRIELERDLLPASVCLARALLHSSMLLGFYTDQEAILSLMTEKPKDVAKFFWDHLEKDIECLAEALSRNTEDATVTVHLFLQHLSNSTTDKGQNMVLNILLRQEDRRQWETCFKTLTQPFFQALEQSLTSVKQERVRDLQGSNLLLQIAYDQMTPFEDQPNLGLVGLSYMWKFEQKMSIQTLMHLLQQEHREDEGNRYPVLLELMSKVQNIQYIQHLPDIFSLQKALIHFFQNSHEGEIYSVQQFLDQHELSVDQRSAFCRAIKTIQKVWNNIKMKPLWSGIDFPDVRVPPDLLQKDINVNTAVLKLLPTPLSIGYFVTMHLIQLQNSCVNTATQITMENQWIISAEEVKPSSVLKITENDLITATLANSQYVIEENGTKTTHFDFQTLQRQMIQRFISGKPIIKAQTAPSLALNSMKTLQYTKMKVREQLQQESLSVNQLKQIMEEVRSVNAISQTLATLKVAAEFLAVTGGDPERQLSEYVKNELKMDASVEQFRDMPVVPEAQLKHILSLWQTLSAKRSVLLVQKNQNPFCLVSEQYHEELSAEKEKALTTVLSTVNLDLFLIELHEMIIVPLDSFDPQWGLKETFRSFLEERQDDACIENLTGTLSPDLLLKDVVSIWKTAVRTSKLHSPTYIQERPT